MMMSAINSSLQITITALYVISYAGLILSMVLKISGIETPPSLKPETSLPPLYPAYKRRRGVRPLCAHFTPFVNGSFLLEIQNLLVQILMAFRIVLDHLLRCFLPRSNVSYLNNIHALAL